MKRTYTIGRDSQNDIVISDPSDLVSRLHATLKVDDRGHYKIIDQSTNGTYVNGIRIEKFADVPVTRKDEITFASVASLDWDEVPKSKKATTWITALVVAVSVIALGLLAYLIINNSDLFGGKSKGTEVVIEEQIDTFKVVTPANCVLAWNEAEVKIEIKGNVAWTAKVTDAEGKEVKDASIDITSGTGEKTITVKLPDNKSTKKDVLYLVTVSTEAKVTPQSYGIQITKSKKRTNPNPNPNPDPQQNDKPNAQVF